MRVLLGCLLGLVIGAVMIYGLVELGNWIVEHT